jgi:ribosomal protein S18 acetylase RimI-like enzyme
MAARRSCGLGGANSVFHLRGDGNENQSFYRNRRVQVPTAAARLLVFPAISSNVIMRDGNGMVAEGVTGVRSPDDAAPRIGFRPQWRILRSTILRSIATSPGAFLPAAGELEAKPPEYWKGRLKSSTWVLVVRRNRILGIAAAKPASEVDDYALQEEACFIESVWIHPSMRGKGLGERLVTNLIEQQRRAAGTRKFYLWVLDYNTPAISLYERMDFKHTWRASELPETQFLREFDSDLVDDDELKQNADARKQDRRDFRITYRLLSAKPAWTHLPRLERLPG